MPSQVLSLESCSYGVCGARGLSIGRWPAGRVMYTGLWREVLGLDEIWGSSVWGWWFLRQGNRWNCPGTVLGRAVFRVFLYLMKLAIHLIWLNLPTAVRPLHNLLPGFPWVPIQSCVKWLDRARSKAYALCVELSQLTNLGLFHSFIRT